MVLSVIKYLKPSDTLNLIRSSKYLKETYDTDVFWNRVVPLPRVTFRVYIKKMIHLTLLMQKYSTVELMDEITNRTQWEILCTALRYVYRKQYMINLLKMFLPDFLQTFRVEKMSLLDIKNAKLKPMDTFIRKHKRRKLARLKYTPV